jgi:hypothetical protein
MRVNDGTGNDGRRFHCTSMHTYLRINVKQTTDIKPYFMKYLYINTTYLWHLRFPHCVAKDSILLGFYTALLVKEVHYVFRDHSVFNFRVKQSRGVPDPKDEGIMILQMLGTIYPTTKCNTPQDVDLRTIFTCIMCTNLLTDNEEHR